MNTLVKSWIGPKEMAGVKSASMSQHKQVGRIYSILKLKNVSVAICGTTGSEFRSRFSGSFEHISKHLGFDPSTSHLTGGMQNETGETGNSTAMYFT